MIRTVLKPQDNCLVFSIPTEYVGKELEVIIFPKDEDEDYLEPDEDFRRAITMEEFRKQVHEDIKIMFANK
ncbi:MAG: hypothetical protein LBE36_11035 [Flavobacteriaceae bacterium]|jgi:hypothetical protein|nr:hypothetical protein [Flavobacteriaceae bacterium]